MCLRTRVQVSKKKVEKSRLILHPYANNKTQATQAADSSSPARLSPARTLLTPTTANVRSPSPNHSPNHVRTLATTTTPGAALPTIETLTNDVGAKWARPLHSLPIAGDFPRLAKVTSIYVGPDCKDITPSPPSTEHPDHPLEHIIYETLIKLAIYLHDPTTLQSTKEHFWDYHKGDVEGEIARNFGMFLKSCLHDGDNVGLVLKSINQAILAPAVIALKMAISSLPFKDYGNSWRVKVIVGDDDFVQIVHVRREQSFNPKAGDAMKFEFVWELSIGIDLRHRSEGEEVEGKVGESSSQPISESPRTSSEVSQPRRESQQPTTSAESLPSPAGSPTLPSPSPTTSKRITCVELKIVEIAFGTNVPLENKEKILGDMRRLTSSTCVVTTIASP